MIRLVRKTIGFLGALWQQKYLIVEFSKKDFKQRFTGSLLGIFWAFINPVVMLFILWFLFTMGFKATAVGQQSVPFFVWLATAMIAWNFFSEALSSSTTVIGEYSFLVKKVNFRLSILPVVKILSALFVHGIFILMLVGILLGYGYSPELYWLQSLYYLGCAVMLALGLSWLTSALNVFMKDVGQIISIILQFGFWLTPIFWQLEMVPEQYRNIFKFNPVYYITEGYRKSFLYNAPLWEESLERTLYFWGFTVLMLLVGILVFRKLRVHFADVI